jgi:four helix bundle protein
MDAEQVKKRTQRFGLEVIRLVEEIPASKTGNIIGNQLLRAGCRGRSKPDFASKIGIAIEEADESLYWMELLVESQAVKKERLFSLIQEANELAILTASLITVRKNLQKSK